jgi:anthranilate synthase component 1
MRDHLAYIQAGAGIVADSVPELEWKETRNKASALIVAIQLAEIMFSGEENKIHA